MKKYQIDYASFSGGYFKKFWLKRNAVREFENTKHTRYRVTLFKGSKKILEQVNENLRPK